MNSPDAERVTCEACGQPYRAGHICAAPQRGSLKHWKARAEAAERKVEALKEASSEFFAALGQRLDRLGPDEGRQRCKDAETALRAALSEAQEEEA